MCSRRNKGRKTQKNRAFGPRQNCYDKSMTRLLAQQADITQLNVDAIVNAANCTLLGGGGVDGAIHRAAGPGLLQACRALNGCQTGQAKITGGFNLPARFVIHTPGPVWHGGNRNEEALLASCYRCALQLAMQHGARTVAFPCISTGVYGYPHEQAAQTALQTVRQFITQNPTAFDAVYFVCFLAEDWHIYQRLLNTHD